MDPFPVKFVFLNSFQYHPTVTTGRVVMEESHVNRNFPIGLQSTDGADDEIISTNLFLTILKLVGVAPLSLRTSEDLMILGEVGLHQGLGDLRGPEAADIAF